MNTFSDLSNKVVLITGGAGSLGSAFCRGFNANGAKVIIADINISAAETLANQFSSGTALPLWMDVADHASVVSAVASAVKQVNQIDILVNNAATKTDRLENFFVADEDFSPEIWREVMRTNLDGMFHVAQEVGRHMLARNCGSIVQIASIYGVVAPDQRIYEGSDFNGHQISSPAVYSVSKAGVLGLTRHLSAAWGARGVRVNSVTPGGVEGGQNQTFVEKYSQRVPLQRMSTPTDIVGAVMFLASDSSSYITGHNLVVDGGLTAW